MGSWILPGFMEGRLVDGLDGRWMFVFISASDCLLAFAAGFSLSIRSWIMGNEQRACPASPMCIFRRLQLGTTVIMYVYTLASCIDNFTLVSVT